LKLSRHNPNNIEITIHKTFPEGKYKEIWALNSDSNGESKVSLKKALPSDKPDVYVGIQ
jgi:hypothetical protein